LSLPRHWQPAHGDNSSTESPNSADVNCSRARARQNQPRLIVFTSYSVLDLNIIHSVCSMPTTAKILENCQEWSKYQRQLLPIKVVCRLKETNATVVPPITRSPHSVGSDNEDIANGYNEVSHPTMNNLSNEVIIRQRGILRPRYWMRNLVVGCFIVIYLVVMSSRPGWKLTCWSPLWGSKHVASHIFQGFLLNFVEILNKWAQFDASWRRCTSPDNESFNEGNHPSARSFFHWTHYGFSIAVMHLTMRDLNSEVTL
jgi:hypothetical protein